MHLRHKTVVSQSNPLRKAFIYTPRVQLTIIFLLLTNQLNIWSTYQLVKTTFVLLFLPPFQDKISTNTTTNQTNTTSIGATPVSKATLALLLALNVSTVGNVVSPQCRYNLNDQKLVLTLTLCCLDLYIIQRDSDDFFYLNYYRV